MAKTALSFLFYYQLALRKSHCNLTFFIKNQFWIVRSKNRSVAFDPSDTATRARIGHWSAWKLVLVCAFEFHFQFLLAQGPDFESIRPILPRTINLCRRHCFLLEAIGLIRTGHKQGRSSKAKQKTKNEFPHVPYCWLVMPGYQLAKISISEYISS